MTHLSHFTGLILTQIRNAVKAASTHVDGADVITVDQLQQNAMWGAHMARVRLAGDPRTYRLILAPAEAPVMIDGRPADQYFNEPLAVEPIPEPCVHEFQPALTNDHVEFCVKCETRRVWSRPLSEIKKGKE